MKKYIIKWIEKYQNNQKLHTHPHCRYYPSCSEYYKIALKRYNIFYATILFIGRFLRCNPLFKGGYDPVREKRAKLLKIDDNIYLLEPKENGKRGPIYYLIDQDEAFLFNAGNSKKHLNLMLKKIKKAHLMPPSFIIVDKLTYPLAFAALKTALPVYGTSGEIIIDPLDEPYFKYEHRHFKLTNYTLKADQNLNLINFKYDQKNHTIVDLRSGYIIKN